MMSGSKGMPLKKEEVMKLITLIETNPVINSKETNATNNLLKDAAWSKITDHFNSMITSCPRKPEQLKLKWENLKKAARKRSSMIKMNNLKTGGGKPEYIPPDDALDRVRAVLGPRSDGYMVPFGGDAVAEVEQESHVVEMALPNCSGADGLTNNDIGATAGTSNDGRSEPFMDSLNTPPKMNKYFFGNKSIGKQKTKKLMQEESESRINRNNAIADYYKLKTKVKQLELEKIELEILEFKKRKFNTEKDTDFS